MFALGVGGVVAFVYYLLIDLIALEGAYANFSEVSQGSSDLATLFTAEAAQNIHRINVFAEGVWALQSAIVAAIGLHGLCTIRR